MKTAEEWDNEFSLGISRAQIKAIQSDAIASERFRALTEAADLVSYHHGANLDERKFLADEILRLRDTKGEGEG